MLSILNNIHVNEGGRPGGGGSGVTESQHASVAYL